jgi:hypothetical protein
MTKRRGIRAEVLDGAPLRLAPENEQGVVFLFAHLAKRWQLRVEEMQQGFPDCIAYQKVRGRENRLRIEFEFKSKTFKTHGHRSGSCDWIVCWEHNWPDVPSNLQVIELRREFGLGFNVWIMPVREPYKKVMARARTSAYWSVPSQAHKGDLVLYYFTTPECYIKYLYVLKDRSQKVTAGWKPGKDFMAPISRYCELDAPLFLDDMQRHRVLRTSGFVRGDMRGRPSATEYWPYLYDMIVRRNPSVRRKLKRYAPQNI